MSLLALMLLSLTALTTARRSPEARIVNGIPIQASKFPWMVSLRIDYVLSIYTRYEYNFCGASLIQLSPPVVLTAAHCVDWFYTNSTGHLVDWEGDDIRLAADINRTDADQEVAGDAYQSIYLQHIDSIVMHEQWNTSRIDLGYDIALLFFGDDQTLDFSEDDLPHLPNTHLSGNEPCCIENEHFHAIGYGRNASNGTATATLEETSLMWVTLDDCVDALENTEQYGYFPWFPTQNVVCAIGNATDTCQGDSGGPLFRMVSGVPEIVGLTSWGFGCALPGLPAVYTSTAHFAKWITNSINWELYGITASPSESPTTAAPTSLTISPTAAPTDPSVSPTKAPTVEPTSAAPTTVDGSGNSGNRMFCVHAVALSLISLLMNL